MAEDADKLSDSAEKAYAAASAAVLPKTEPAKPVESAVAVKPEVAPEAPKAADPAPVAPVEAVPKAAVKAAKPVKAVKKASAKVAKSKPARKKPVKKTSKPVAAAAKVATPASKPKPSITELKDKIMATAKSTDFSKTVTDAVSEFQRRAKEAYDKSAEMSVEATEFAKGNVEALVESGKILAAGVQDLGKTYADDAKSAYETVTADFKEFAAVKSPTEFFQLQTKLLRRNFETLVAYSSKNTEAVVKLANESIAPISSRVNVAAEKLAKAA